ncbi:MAG: hypothetical protein AAFR16_04910 [Pseudomonadota bacterium]
MMIALLSFPLLLLTLLLAFAVMGSTLYSISQVIGQEGRLRTVHAAAAAATLLQMAILLIISEKLIPGVAWIPIIRAVGLAGLAVAGLAVIFERGWSRLSPLPIAIFSFLIAQGAPFGG